MKINLLMITYLALLTTYSSAFAQTSDENYKHLDNLALEYGTDRSSAFHRYTKVYSKYFASLQNKPIKFLEIGISEGNSVKLWEAYFPNAELHFIDIDMQKIKYFSKRSEYHKVDQGNRLELTKFAKQFKEPFDIILDDGGHQVQQQITSFKTLFPYLKSGGMYIIEDLHTSYWNGFGGRGSPEKPISGLGTTTEYLKGLVDDLNYIGARTQCADSTRTSPSLQKELNYFQEKIESLHFYGSLCIVIKK